MIEPISYLEMQRLEMEAKLILTDSGGVQKEAFFHSRLCTTIRANTEWPETLVGDWNRLVDGDVDALTEAFNRQTPKGTPPVTSFGDGQAGPSTGRVIQEILNQLD